MLFVFAESENGNDSKNMNYLRLSLPNVAEANSLNLDSSGKFMILFFNISMKILSKAKIN